MDFSNMTTSDIERMMLENAVSQHDRLSKPDDGAKWLALAQAMGSPTRTGSFGESLGNVAGGLGQYHSGEQVRRSSADDAMQKALSIVYKQKMDLEERKQKLKDSMKRKFFQTSEGTFGFADEDNQTVDVRALGPSQMKIVEKIQDRYVDILSKQGQYTDANDLRQAAYKLAMRDYTQMVNDTNFVPAKVGVDRGDEPSPIVDQINIRPTIPVSGANLSKESALSNAIDVAPGGIMTSDSDNIFGKPVGIDPTGDPRYGKMSGAKVATPSVLADGIPIKTPQQIEQENRDIADRKKIDYDESRKEYTELSKKRAEYVPTMNSVSNMEALTLQGANQGPLAEVMGKTLGGYMNYFDPNDSLARFAGNDEAYFAEMMNLVRGKISALGAGTAISNLDLLVSQLSSGDIRTTKQGRLKLIGAVKAALENAKIEQDSKMKYFQEHGNTMVGWKPPSGSQAMLVPKKVIGNSHTGKEVLTKYDIVTYDQWADATLKNNPGLEKYKDRDKFLRKQWDETVKESRKLMGQ